ncbi:MAG: ribulose-phosphate 3-epimerase, partial [Clostridia bacterium]
QSDLIFDVHLMINHPLLYIKDFVEAGADIITFHLECEDNTLEVINKIKSYGVKVGISIKPKTKADEVFKYLSLVDMVLVMTVEPGFGGLSFMEAQMPKIKNLKEYINKNNLNIPIEVDGGINDKTVKIAKENGANIFVAGSYIFEKTNYMKAVESLL